MRRFLCLRSEASLENVLSVRHYAHSYVRYDSQLAVRLVLLEVIHLKQILLYFFLPNLVSLQPKEEL